MKRCWIRPCEIALFIVRAVPEKYTFLLSTLSPILPFQLAYRKNYEDTKANVHIPSDMLNHLLAKKCQYILSDLEYRTYLHQWNCSPEENDVVLAKKAQEILSDVCTLFSHSKFG